MNKLGVFIQKFKKCHAFHAFLVFLLMSMIFHLIAYRGDFHRIINGGDIDYPINAWLELKRSFSLWSSDALGVPVYFSISKFFLLFPQLLIQTIFQSTYLANFIYFSLLRAAAGLFMFMLLKHLKLPKVAIFIGSIFFMLNIYVYFRFQFPQPHLYYAYISLPLLIYLFIRSFDGSLKFYFGIGLFSLVMMAISRTANMFLAYWIIVPLFAFVIRYAGYTKFKIDIKKIFLFFFISCLLNSAVFFTFISAWLNYSDYPQMSLLDVYRDDSIRFAKDYKIYETMAGFGSYAWSHNLSDVKPGFHNFPILKYLPKSFLLFTGLLPLVFALLANLKSMKKKWVLFILLLFFGVLITAYGWPTGWIYEMTLGKVGPYTDLFRDSWTYWSMPYFFLLSLLIAFGFSKGFSIKSAFSMKSDLFLYSILRVQFLLFMALVTIMLYVFPGSMINPAWINEIPKSYTETAEFLDKNAKGERVLALPLTRHVYGYTYTDWGYAGPDIMQRLADVGFTDKHFNQLAPNKTISMLDSIIEPDAEKLGDFLYRTQINWILLRKDFIDEPGDGSKNRVSQFEGILNSLECWDVVNETDDLVVYKNICGNYARESVEISSEYVYGGVECEKGLPVDKYLEGSASCGKKPKDDSFEIEGNSLSYEDGSTLRELDLKGDKHDLLANYNFRGGVWNAGDVYTCDPDDPDAKSINISPLRSNKGVNIKSKGQKVCIFEPILNENIGAGVILKVKYSNNSGQDVGYCIFDLDESYCYSHGTLGVDSRSDNLIVKREVDGKYTTDYLYVDNFSEYKNRENMFLYLHFNEDKVSDFSVDVVETRMVSLPADYEGSIFNENALDSGKSLSVDVRHSIVGEFVSWPEVKGDFVVSFNESKSNQWKLVGIKDGRFKMISDENRLTSYGYAKGWFVEDIENYDSFVLIYIPQLVFILGSFMTFWVYLMYICVYCYAKLRKSRLKKL